MSRELCVIAIDPVPVGHTNNHESFLTSWIHPSSVVIFSFCPIYWIDAISSVSNNLYHVYLVMSPRHRKPPLTRTFLLTMSVVRKFKIHIYLCVGAFCTDINIDRCLTPVYYALKSLKWCLWMWFYVEIKKLTLSFRVWRIKKNPERRIQTLPCVRIQSPGQSLCRMCVCVGLSFSGACALEVQSHVVHISYC